MTTEQGKVQFIIEAIDKASSELKSVQTAGLALSAAVTSIAGAFTLASKMSMDYGEKILSLSKITGETTQTLSGLAFAAEQNETSIQAVTLGLGLLSKNMIGAQQGSAEMKNKFAEMGISIFDTDGKMKSATTVMMEMADFMKNSGKSDTEKMAIAMLLLGRSGKELIPLMKEGSAGIKGMITEAGALGVVIDEATAKALDNMGDELSKVKTGMLGVALILTKELTPYIKETTAAIINVIKTFNSWDAESRSVNIGMALFGVKLLALAAGVLLLQSYIPKAIVLFKAFGVALNAVPFAGVAIAIVGIAASIAEYMYQVEKTKNRNQQLGQSHKDILKALIKNNDEIKEQIRTHKVAGDEAKRLSDKYENQKTAIKKLTIEVENEKEKKKDLGDTNKELLIGMSLLEVAQEDGYNAYLKNEEAITAQEKATKDIVAVMGSYEVKIGDVHDGMIDLEETTVDLGTKTKKMSDENAAAFITMARTIFESGATLENTFKTVVDGVSRMFDPVTGAAIQLSGSIIEKMFWGNLTPEVVIDENKKIILDYLDSLKMYWSNFGRTIAEIMSDALQTGTIAEGYNSFLTNMTKMFKQQITDVMLSTIMKLPMVQFLIENIMATIRGIPDAITGGSLEAQINAIQNFIADLAGYLTPIFQIFARAMEGFDIISPNLSGGSEWSIPAMASGGVVMPSPGGTLVRVAEAGQAEAIVPLNKMGGVTVNINNGMFLGTRAEMDSVFRKYLLPAMENYLGKTGGAFG